MIKEKELPKAVVSNKLISQKATDLTIMSYDKNVHKLIIPTDLTQAEISDIIVLITFRYHENIIQINGELVEDKIEIILPNEIRSLSGEFYIEIDINLTDNRQITFARYRANVVKSDIDSVDLDDVPEFYFELFDDIVQKVSEKSEQSVEEMYAIVETVSEQSTAEMAATVKQVTDKSEVAVAEIDAHKQAVSDKADTAIAGIVDTTDSVTTAKQSALTSITQATSDVTDASAQFTVDLADTQSNIDAQVTQAQDNLQEVSDTLTAVNDKAATVNDTADSFVADVADKSQLVDDKYQQFDDNATQANGSLTEILGNIDAKIKNEATSDYAIWTATNADILPVEGVADTITKVPTATKSYLQSPTALNYHDKFYMTSLVQTTDNKVHHSANVQSKSNYHTGSGKFERLSTVLNIDSEFSYPESYKKGDLWYWNGEDFPGRNLLLGTNADYRDADRGAYGDFVPDRRNNNIKITPGTKLRLSCCLKNESKGAVRIFMMARCLVEENNSDGKIEFTSEPRFGSGEEGLTELQFEFPDGLSYLIPFTARFSPRATERIYFKYKNELLTKGSEQYPWSPAPEDLTNGQSSGYFIATKDSDTFDFNDFAYYGNTAGDITIQWAYSDNDALLDATVKAPVVINLTQTFGSGNEPTKSEMDTLINILGGWFDGEITLTQMQQLNWLLKLIRQNALATTALGGTIL